MQMLGLDDWMPNIVRQLVSYSRPLTSAALCIWLLSTVLVNCQDLMY
jgi:hypothetical protein